eukprot:1672882-Prymnesium_polylepis.1
MESSSPALSSGSAESCASPHVSTRKGLSPPSMLLADLLSAHAHSAAAAAGEIAAPGVLARALGASLLARARRPQRPVGRGSGALIATDAAALRPAAGRWINDDTADADGAGAWPPTPSRSASASATDGSPMSVVSSTPLSDQSAPHSMTKCAVLP